MGFAHSDIIEIREVWRGTAQLIYRVRVVEDAGDFLTVFLASGTPLVSPEGSWPWGRTHPWAEIGTWNDHGVLQILSAIDPVSVWVFWRGADRRFDAWYINLQEAFRRVNGGIETQDLELDFVIAPDGSWHTKDEELLDGWIESGRWSREEVAHIREIGRRVAADLGSGRRWWDERWASWDPPIGWEPWRPE